MTEQKPLFSDSKVTDELRCLMMPLVVYNPFSILMARPAGVTFSEFTANYDIEIVSSKSEFLVENSALIQYDSPLCQNDVKAGLLSNIIPKYT